MRRREIESEKHSLKEKWRKNDRKNDQKCRFFTLSLIWLTTCFWRIFTKAQKARKIFSLNRGLNQKCAFCAFLRFFSDSPLLKKMVKKWTKNHHFCLCPKLWITLDPDLTSFDQNWTRFDPKWPKIHEKHGLHMIALHRTFYFTRFLVCTSNSYPEFCF